MQQPHKYARVERERRFLLDRFPNADVVRLRQITDIDGTRLRLRKQNDDGGPAIYKLTQKLPGRTSGAQQGWITSISLTEGEFRLLAQLPAKMLSKVRHSVPPFGIDVFEGALQGLQLAEAEFNSDAEADALIIPEYILHEVSDDRFAGGQLVCASRANIEELLAEYGMTLSDAHQLRSPHERVVGVPLLLSCWCRVTNRSASLAEALKRDARFPST